MTADGGLLGPPHLRRRLEALRGRRLNYDPALLLGATSRQGWTIEDLCQQLPGEPPGPPLAAGSWEVARRLMRGYEFADPSIVRAFYDRDRPLQGRDMLLKLQALRVLHTYAGVRVVSVVDETRVLDGRGVRVWGWSYGTLEGHLEMGRMTWEVWKWIDSGAVEFRVRSVSRPAPAGNPFVWLGFRVLRSRERRTFLESTKRRMAAFTALGVSTQPTDQARAASRSLTARPLRDDDPAHDQLARSLEERRPG